MHLVINLRDIRGEKLKQDLETFREAGFTAVDYGLFEMVRDDSPLCGGGWREEVLAIRAACDACGMPVVQTHAPFQFKNEDWDDTELFEKVTFPRIVRSLEISSILGARVIVVHPIHHMLYQGHAEEIFEQNMVYYRRLIPYCEQFGVKIAVENMFQKDPRRKCIVHDTCSRPEEMIRYVDTLNSPWIVACLDVGHVALPVQDTEPWDFIRALGHDRLQSLHIHDNDFTGDQHLVPYLGKIRWEEVCRALGEIDYQGDFTYEVKLATIREKEPAYLPIAARFMGDVGKHLVEMIDANRPQK